MQQPDLLGRDALQAFDNLFGLHPGYRPVHAKGILLSGTFAPSSSIRTLTRGPHVSRPLIPIALRISDFTGIPAIPDHGENASPRCFAVRFYLAEQVHTPAQKTTQAPTQKQPATQAVPNYRSSLATATRDATASRLCRLRSLLGSRQFTVGIIRE
jgi:hypothetical protein